MNKKNIKFILPVVIILIFILIFCWYNFFRPLDIKVLDVDFKVAGISGVNVDSSDTLDFGIVLPGNSISKKVKISNNFDFPVEVTILATKEIQPFVFSDNKVIILPGENKLVTFNLEIPQNASYGSYSGQIKLEFKKK